MAKIVFSKDAPSGETVHFTFPEGEFDLGGKAKSYSTTDRALLAGASAHPWLEVQYDKSEQTEPTFIDRQVKPEDDPFSAVGPNAGIAFDPAEVRKAEEAKGYEIVPTAIDAGLDQDKKVTEGGVAETVAASNSNDTKGDS